MQKRNALKVTSAYRTVSAKLTVPVVVGVIPVTLLPRERQTINKRKREVGKKYKRREAVLLKHGNYLGISIFQESRQQRSRRI